jgi:hypothetical protein
MAMVRPLQIQVVGVKGLKGSWLLLVSKHKTKRRTQKE